MPGDCARCQVWADIADSHQDVVAIELVMVGYLVMVMGDRLSTVLAGMRVGWIRTVSGIC